MATINIRIDDDLKKEAESILDKLGLNISVATIAFYKRLVRDGGIPFDLKLDTPNAETLAALLEAERISRDPSVKGYADLEVLLRDLKA